MVQDMGRKNVRFKEQQTRYPGVRFIYGTSPSTGKEEKIYIIWYRRDGKVFHEKAGRESIDGMTAAKANALRIAKMEGRLPSNKAQREAEAALKERMTVDKIAQEYFRLRIKTKSLGSDRSKYNVHIKPALGDKIPEEVDPLALERFRAGLSKTQSTRGKKPLSKTTIHHIMSQLRAIINWGVRRRLTTGFRGTTPVPPMPKNMRTEDLTDDQLLRLLNVLDAEEDQDAADVVRLAIYTGARRAEILSLKWDDVDLSRGVWILRDRKDGADTGFPLSIETQELLSRRLSMRTESPYVFPGTGKDGYMKDPRAAFERIKKALPPGFRILHGQRHAAASRLVSAGVDLYVVSKILGHSTPELTAKRYAHLRPGVIANAAQLAGTLVSDVAAKAKEKETEVTS